MDILEKVMEEDFAVTFYFLTVIRNVWSFTQSNWTANIFSVTLIGYNIEVSNISPPADTYIFP